MNIVYEIDSIEGHKFILKLSSFEEKPIDCDIEIVDIALLSYTENDAVNNAGTFGKIASLLLNFLKENDAILYFYCDSAPINKSRSRDNISHQKFRSMLFTAMYKRAVKNNEGEYVHKYVAITDSSGMEHYLHLMSKKKFANEVESMIQLANTLSK